MAWKVDPGTLLTATGTLFVVAIAWANLSNKVDRLSEDLANKADKGCLALVQSQAEAEEKSRRDVVAVLSTVAEQQGCFARPAEGSHAFTVGRSIRVPMKIDRSAVIWKQLETADAMLAATPAPSVSPKPE